MHRVTLPTIVCLLAIAVTTITTATRKDEKNPDADDKSSAGLIAQVEQLKQRVAKLEEQIKQLEAKLEDKTNPFGKMNELDKRIAKKLQDPLPINFDANKLVNVIDYFKNTTGCNFFVNWAALEAAGVEQATPITLQLKNVAAAHAIKLTLIQASPKGGDNTAVFQVHNGVVYITTKTDMKRLTDD